jgi:hypothetical protein
VIFVTVRTVVENASAGIKFALECARFAAAFWLIVLFFGILNLAWPTPDYQPYVYYRSDISFIAWMTIYTIIFLIGGTAYAVYQQVQHDRSKLTLAARTIMAFCWFQSVLLFVGVGVALQTGGFPWLHVIVVATPCFLVVCALYWIFFPRMAWRTAN